MENDRRREPWNRFAEHPIERTQCLPPWRRLGANAFRRNEGSWAWIERIIGTFFRDLHLRHGPRGLTPHYYRWSYGLSTLVFIVFPDALTQGFTGDDPNMKFLFGLRRAGL